MYNDMDLKACLELYTRYRLVIKVRKEFMSNFFKCNPRVKLN